MRPIARITVAALAALLLVGLALAGQAAAAPEGTMAWGLHVTLASRWLDPIDTEAFINQFMCATRPARSAPRKASSAIATNSRTLAETWRPSPRLSS